MRRAVADHGETVDYTVAAHRRVFCDVMRWLEDHGVLQVVDGDREAFASGDERAVEALYNIDRVRLDRLAPTFLIADASREDVRRRALPDPASGDAAACASRAASWRTRPCTSPTCRATSTRTSARPAASWPNACARSPGWSPSTARRARSSSTRPLGEATDLRFPTFQRDRQAALLIGAGIAAEHGQGAFTHDDVRRVARDLLTAHPKYFVKLEETLAREAVEQLTALDLLRGGRRGPEAAARLRPLPRGGRHHRRTDRDTGELAVNARGRFTRMGVINLYEYANEVFVFEDGKLVIKGANGVGKSRALELTYPLLLEGNIAEYRVDTTGKQGRPFAWNLSLGDVYTRRVGYAWLEAELADGEHVTIGMGASGGQSGGSQTTDSTWFFVLRGSASWTRPATSGRSTWRPTVSRSAAAR